MTVILLDLDIRTILKTLRTDGVGEREVGEEGQETSLSPPPPLYLPLHAEFPTLYVNALLLNSVYEKRLCSKEFELACHRGGSRSWQGGHKHA